ncbi:MAG: SBBP repeat-containing protein, partial [Anaerolineae bacterium]
VAAAVPHASAEATAAVPHAPSEAAAAAPRLPAEATSDKAALPAVQFIENRGQLPERVLFYTQGRDGRVDFTASAIEITELVCSVGPCGVHGRRASSTSAGRREGLPARVEVNDAGMAVWRPDLAAFVRTEAHTTAIPVPGISGEASRELELVARDTARTRLNFFRGGPDEWIINVPTFRTVVYRDVQPGTDVEFTLTDRGLEYRVSGERGLDDLAPGRRRFDGFASRELYVGDLALAQLRNQSHDSGADQAGVAVSLAYGSFFGTVGEDRGLGVAVDRAGSAYICGEGQEAGTGSNDAYVAKLTSDGQAYEYVAYIGGSSEDGAFDVAVDAQGHAYVVGYTFSNQSSFPVVGGPDLTYNLGADTLVAKLAPDGSDLIYAGYLGGDGLDFAEGVAVDADGNAFVTGATGSLQQTFPVTVGPDLTFNGQPSEADSDLDAFVAKIVPEPTSSKVQDNLAYAGYIGGRENDVGVSDDGFLTAGQIALGADGSAYVSGMTESNHTSFPDGDGFGSLGGPDRTHNGGYDGWVARVRADGTDLEWAGYVGGRGFDQAFGMAVDAEGNAYLTGTTLSISLPEAAVGPDLSYNGGRDGDAIVAKVLADGSGFAYLGYLGGNLSDGGFGVALAPDESLYVIGYTESGEGSFPVIGGPDLSQNDNNREGDAFVCRLKPTPDAAEPVDNYVSCGYIGGSKYDQAFWVAVDAGSGAAFVVGDTESDEATFPDGDGFGALPGAEQVHAGDVDAFVVKLAAGDEPSPTSTSTPTPTPTPIPSGTATPSDTPATAAPSGTASTVTPTPTGATGSPTVGATATGEGPTSTATVDATDWPGRRLYLPVLLNSTYEASAHATRWTPDAQPGEAQDFET